MKTVNPSTSLEDYGERSRTIKFYTLGCKVNQYDTQSIRESFIRAGFKELEDSQPARFYVINTCTVTHKADRDSLNAIRKAKRENPKAEIIVTGCLAESDEGKIKKIAGISLIIKNKDKENILERQTDRGISYFRGHTRAFLKIQDGCNNSCSYCKVPGVRGKSRSKPLNQIIYEANRLVKNGFTPLETIERQQKDLVSLTGFKEIVLCGICLGAYGRDLKPRINLVDVIEELEKIPGLSRIRLSSIEAGDIPDELIAKMSRSKKLCQHLHIPFQSGDDEILKKMNRKITFGGYLNLIRRIKSRIPEIAITTDIMVGFPQETEKNFQNTLKLIRQVLPLKVHIFPYSRREGTAAAVKFKQKLSPEIIKERVGQLKNIAQDCAFRYKKQFLNKDMEVLIEGRRKDNPGFWKGHTCNYMDILVKSNQNLKNQIILTKLKSIFKDSVLAE